jgi:hypothetical protein
LCKTEEPVKTLTLSSFHLPHRHHAAQETTEHPHERRRALIGGVVAAYLTLTLILLVAAQELWSMSWAESWGFAVGVASYILLFSGFIGGLVWVCVNNLADDPSRR